MHRLVTLLADGRTVLAHCFAGKDRTGFTVALVLEAAGVDRDAIVADFLTSNQAVPLLRERILNTVRQRADVEMTPELLSTTEARLSEEVLGVRAEYLDAARRTIDDNFGSLDGYFRSAGVTEADVARLRDALARLVTPASALGMESVPETRRMRYHACGDIACGTIRHSRYHLRPVTVGASEAPDACPHVGRET